MECINSVKNSLHDKVDIKYKGSKILCCYNSKNGIIVIVIIT